MIFVERVAGGDSAALGDDEPEGDRGRLVVGEHQRRQSRAGAEPVPAADAGLPVDRDADVVERDRVPADRPLGHAEVGGGRAPVHHRTGLEQLEEGEQARGRPRHAPRFNHGCGQKVSAIVRRLPSRSSDAKERRTWGQDGRHDFDFLFGAWQIANRKRVNPLVPGDDEWIEFDALLGRASDRRRAREHRHVPRARLPRPPRLRGLHAAPVRAEDRRSGGSGGHPRPASRAARRAGRRPLRGRRRRPFRVRRHHRRRARPRPLRLDT